MADYYRDSLMAMRKAVKEMQRSNRRLGETSQVLRERIRRLKRLIIDRRKRHADD